MKDFRSLVVWRKAHELALDVYGATSTFPREERFGLIGQLRRAASSVPANIAEGCGRGGNAELARFLQISAGSLWELDYHLLLAHDLRWLDSSRYTDLERRIVEVKQMLNALIQKVNRDKRVKSDKP